MTKANLLQQIQFIRFYFRTKQIHKDMALPKNWYNLDKYDREDALARLQVSYEAKLIKLADKVGATIIFDKDNIIWKE